MSKSWVVVILQLISLQLNNSDKDFIQLDQGNDEIEYYFGTNVVSWDEANAICRSMKAHLLSIDTKEEMKLLFENLRKKFEDRILWWTSGGVLNDQWLWLATGNNITHPLWCANHPKIDSPGTDHCLALDVINECWRDLQCMKLTTLFLESRHICERRVKKQF